MRETVQEAIKLFIQEHRDTSEKKYNRFLITSRVAGYDQAAFPDFPHYLIAELTSKQINYFLPRWSRASVSHVRGMKIDDENELKEAIANEVEWKMKELKVAINDNQGIHELAENPLLLTLLAVMQQNSIELPRQRVELYSVVTRTLLENRNIAKNLEPIPEAKVIQRLGPLAYKMQKEGNSFIRQRDVMESLVESISSSDGGTLNDIEEEAQRFLKRIRERAGLFVQRTGDYFGFMHRTFQEYFAARYLLNQIKLEREKWISKLVEQARSKDALWREPFLLAVAYQSRDNEQIAGEIVYTLLGNPQGILSKDDERYLLLAAESLIETIPYTIDIALDRRVVKQLLQTYEIALDSRDFETCDQIEGIIQRWLKAIPRESYRPPILIVLSEIISDSSQSVLQRATLMLLNVIAQKLQSCSSVVLDMLISPLLALAGLPSVGKYQPTPDLPVSSYSDMVDFALNTLFLLGKRGPYGLLLDDVREQFNDHPEYLRKLADLSLKSGKIMTPFPPPLAEVNYQLYTSAIGRWIALNESMINQIALRISVPDIDTSLSIHLALLNCAEEVYYAITIPLLDILKAVDEHPERPWQQTLQTYLSNQLFAGRFNNYQEIVLLWAILFPHEQEQKKLANILLEHFNGSDISVQLCAQHLLASLSRSLEHSWNLRDLRYITFILNSAYWRYSPNIEELRYLQDSARQSVSNNQKLLFKILDSQQPHHLNKLLFTKEISMRAIERLSFANSASSNLAEYVDLLCILMGRVIQIAKQDEIGQAIEVEIQQIAHIAITCFTHTNIEVVSQTILDIICCLPARSVNEIKFILQLAEGTTNEQMQHACAKALLKNRPKTPEANATLELIKQSKVEVLSTELQNYFEEI